MWQFLNGPGIASALANAGAFLVLLWAVNLPAPWLGLRFEDKPANVLFAPPGYVVVAAWLMLFPAMGVSRWLLVRSPAPGAEQRWVVGLAIVCATYAYYTLGIARLTGVSPAVYGLVGNICVIAFAALLAARVWALSHLAALLISGVAVWTAFASISVVQLVVKELRP